MISDAFPLLSLLLSAFQILKLTQMHSDSSVSVSASFMFPPSLRPTSTFFPKARAVGGVPSAACLTAHIISSIRAASSSSFSPYTHAHKQLVFIADTHIAFTFVKKYLVPLHSPGAAAMSLSPNL